MTIEHHPTSEVAEGAKLDAPDTAPAAQLAERYATSRDGIVHYVRKTLGSRNAEDCVQEAFLGAWRQLCRNPTNTHALGITYITRAAQNRAIDAHRRKSTCETPVDIDESRKIENGFSAQPPKDPQEYIPELLGIETALERLSPQNAALVRLRILGGFSVEETANQLGIPPGTVKSRLSRTLAQLRKMPDIKDLLAP